MGVSALTEKLYFVKNTNNFRSDIAEISFDMEKLQSVLDQPLNEHEKEVLLSRADEITIQTAQAMGALKRNIKEQK